jgi:6-phosphogluconolactonase (cycloisomerase 2 family)
MRIVTGTLRSHGRRIVASAVIIAAGVFGMSSLWRLWQKAGAAKLLSIEEIEPEACDRPTGSELLTAQTPNLFSTFESVAVHAQDANAAQNAATGEKTNPPVRQILDTAPIYSSVAVDTNRDEVYLQDSNLWSIRVFSRTDNAKPGDPPTEPRRVIMGENTALQFNSCVWVDPAAGDVYSVENDTGNIIAVYPREATGDVKPKRVLKVTHRAYAMMINAENKELFLSVQFPPQVAVYSKDASGDDKPLRLLEGPHTRLADSHGIAVDPKRKLMFVDNWGNISDLKVAGTGRFELPSISVYDINASGDTPPLRVIQGPKTRLDWPGVLSIDQDTGDLYVANDVDQSIIVFHSTDQGDVAPARVIKGANTRLNYPVGIFVDSKNKEVWATNIGNSSATVYPLMGNGDVAPLRTIRSADANKQSLRFGKTSALVYDSKREEIMIPNCVIHPQIASFSRLAGANTPPVRVLEGQKTRISRTMHGFAYDSAHDEVVVTSPLAQAILVFRGGAKGEEEPIRIIQGPHTQIQGDYPGTGANDRVSVDSVNGEYYMYSTPNQILVFDRTGNGDVPPKRILGGSETQIRGRSNSMVDTVRNLLVVNSRNKLLIFDRTASGNVKPKGIIEGPKANLNTMETFQVYPPKGLVIVANRAGAVGAWSDEVYGDVAPKFLIPVKQLTGYDALGIALDPVHKEVMFSSAASERSHPTNGIMNTVMTFSWPEVF